MARIVVTQDNQTIQVSSGDTVIVDIPGGGTVNIVGDGTTPVSVFRIEFGGDTEEDTVNVDLSTFTGYGLHIDIKDYDPNDTVSLQSAFNTTVDAGNEDEFNFQYVGANGATFDGYIRAKDKGEQNFTSDPPPIIICFADGTVIDTDLGPTPIEALKSGDLVRTLDNGLQVIRWIGKRTLDSLDLARHPQLRPICFKAGSLGRGFPHIDLTVSPQHRMHVSGWQAELHYGCPEVLIPAIGFLNGDDIAIDALRPCVTYFHLLFDKHEIVTANGVRTESLHTGQLAMMSLDDQTAQEIRILYPDSCDLTSTGDTARPVVRRRENVVAQTFAA